MAQREQLNEELQKLPVESFEQLRLLLGLRKEGLARHLGIAPGTLYRRMASGRFTAKESDRLARLIRLFSRSVEVLGNDESAKEWFDTPNPSLRGVTPLSVSQSDPGSVEVERLLGRIEEGVF
jgi:putative toxin-antitoxin system antitoxin component (TIGR02293 family)